MSCEDDFVNHVLTWVKAIPPAQVATYGQIAALAGKPRNARQVGRILYGLTDQDDVPWHRVINAQGAISTYRVGTGELQHFLLTQEGVHFDDQGRCKLSTYQWWP
jgi:methylated-DNA-protein-cysteine methyltransferase related protein